MFRDTLQKAHTHAKRLFGQARTVYNHVDRVLGTAAKVYNTIAPILAPLAIERLGSERAHRIHGNITSGIKHYEVARERGHRIGTTVGALANAIKHP